MGIASPSYYDQLLLFKLKSLIDSAINKKIPNQITYESFVSDLDVLDETSRKAVSALIKVTIARKSQRSLSTGLLPPVISPPCDSQEEESFLGTGGEDAEPNSSGSVSSTSARNVPQLNVPRSIEAMFMRALDRESSGRFLGLRTNPRLNGEDEEDDSNDDGDDDDGGDEYMGPEPPEMAGQDAVEMQRILQDYITSGSLIDVDTGRSSLRGATGSMHDEAGIPIFEELLTRAMPGVLHSRTGILTPTSANATPLSSVTTAAASPLTTATTTTVGSPASSIHYYNDDGNDCPILPVTSASIAEASIARRRISPLPQRGGVRMTGIENDLPDRG